MRTKHLATEHNHYSRLLN